MSVTKIEAWKTSYEGKIFENEEDAIEYDNRTQEMFKRHTTFGEKEEWINQFIKDNYAPSDFRNEECENTEPYFLPHGWECDGEHNPIDKCVYSHELYWGDDGCVFCGEPEERK